MESGVGDDLPAGTSVRYHYNCYLEYCDEPIDSTHFRNRMGKTKLGDADVLQGIVRANKLYMWISQVFYLILM